MEHDPKTKPTEDDAGQSQAISETKMRQALGIDSRGHATPSHTSGGSGAQRRRFVSDGDVPVVMIGRRRDHAATDRPDQTASLSERITAAEAQLASEREARLRAEAQLADARHTIQNLQAKVAHADLAREEAVAHAQRAASERSEALRELQDAQQPPRPAPQRKPERVQEPEPAAVRASRETSQPPDAGCDVPAFTAQILSAYLARNRLSPAELPVLAENVMHALVGAAPRGGR